MGGNFSSALFKTLDESVMDDTDVEQENASERFKVYFNWMNRKKTSQHIEKTTQTKLNLVIGLSKKETCAFFRGGRSKLL